MPKKYIDKNEDELTNEDLMVIHNDIDIIISIIETIDKYNWYNPKIKKLNECKEIRSKIINEHIDVFDFLSKLLTQLEDIKNVIKYNITETKDVNIIKSNIIEFNVECIVNEIISKISYLKHIFMIIGLFNSVKFYTEFKPDIIRMFENKKMQLTILKYLCAQNTQIGKDLLFSLNFNVLPLDIPFDLLKCVSRIIRNDDTSFDNYYILDYDLLLTREINEYNYIDELFDIFSTIFNWKLYDLFVFLLNKESNDLFNISNLIINILMINLDIINENTKHLNLMKQFLIINKNKFLFLNNDRFIEKVIEYSGRKIFSYENIPYDVFNISYNLLIPFWSEQTIFNLIKNINVSKYFYGNEAKEKYINLMNKKRRINLITGIYLGGNESLFLIPSLNELYFSLQYV